MKTLILGIGNTLLSDEGVGIHVLAHLQTGVLPEGVTLLDGGTLSFTLAASIQEADTLIVVDAANLRSPPGTLQVFLGQDMDDFLVNNRKSSVHEVGLTDLRAIALLTGHWPERRALVAIQPMVVDWGELPSAPVAAAIPAACAAIHALLEQWHEH